MKTTTNTYTLPQTTTPEKLQETMGSRTAIISFGKYVLVAGYHYDPKCRCYYGAIYRFTGRVQTCCGEIKLVNVSKRRFEDDGHALAWAMGETI